MGKEAQGKQGIASAASGNAPDAGAPTRPQPDFMALGALAGAMFLWSGTFIAMKVALTAFHPVFMIFVRMVGSVLLLSPFLMRWARGTPYRQGDWRIIALMVFSEPCLYFMFEAYALRYTTASQAGIITSLLPLLVGVGAFFFLKERLGAKAWLGFALAVAGVAALTLFGEDSAQAPNALLGNALEFGAMLMACIYTLCVRKLAGYQPFFISAMQSFAGMVFFGLMFALMGGPLPDSAPGAGPLLALVFLAFATLVAYGMYNFGVARLSAGRAAAWINLIPVLTLFLGIMLLDERLTLAQALAVIPIIGGVVLSQLADRKK